jgi:HK97 family phage major capsid protein
VENPTVSAYLDRLFDEYRRAAKAGQDTMDLAAGEARDLTPEEMETRDRAFEDVTRLKGEIEKIQNFENIREAGDVFRAAAAPVVERATGKPATDREMFRSMFSGGGGYDSRLSGYLTDGDPNLAHRALQATGGGSAVETSFADFVTVVERTFSPMLRPDVSTVLNRTDGSPLVLPRLTADVSVAGTITAEAAGITEGDPTISAITLNPYKYAITNLWSAELADDNTIGLEDLVARTTGRSLGIAIGNALTTGDGTDDPNGIIVASTVFGTASGTGATAGTYFGATDLVNLYYSVASPYRTVGSWMANSTTLAQIRNARTSDGIFLWQPSLQVGQPESILGRPIYENPGMASGSAAKAVIFGDLSRYIVARVVPIRVESSIHYKFNTDQIALRTIERVDGDLVDTAATRVLLNVAV